MDFLNFKDAFLIGVFMAFMIGPVFFMLIKTSILKGAKAAIAFDLGVVSGDIFFMTIAYFGSRKLLEQVKDDPRLFLFGGIILIIYGIITYFDKNNKKDIVNTNVEVPDANNYFKLFINGFLLNFINIGVLAFWLGLLVVIGPVLEMDATRIFWYLTVVILGYLCTDFLKIFLAKQLKNKLTPLVIYRIKKGMAVLLIIFGAIMVSRYFIPKEQINTIIEQGEKLIKK